VENNRADEAAAILVGSKADEVERRVVPEDDARALADRHNMQYIEVSSKTGAGVSDAFHLLAMAMLNSQLEADPRNPLSTRTPAPASENSDANLAFSISRATPPRKGGCCGG